MLSQRTVHPSFDCSQPFCSPFRCSWWFGRTQDKAKTRQPGTLCGWSGRLEQSPIAHSFRTYIMDLKHAQDTSFLTFLLHWLTVSRVRAANIVRRPCSDYSHVMLRLKIVVLLLWLCLLSIATRCSSNSVWMKDIRYMVRNKIYCIDRKSTEGKKYRCTQEYSEILKQQCISLSIRSVYADHIIIVGYYEVFSLQTQIWCSVPLW